jgi:hypothetical protein
LALALVLAAVLALPLIGSFLRLRLGLWPRRALLERRRLSLRLLLLLSLRLGRPLLLLRLRRGLRLRRDALLRCHRYRLGLRSLVLVVLPCHAIRGLVGVAAGLDHGLLRRLRVTLAGILALVRGQGAGAGAELRFHWFQPLRRCSHDWPQ